MATAFASFQFPTLFIVTLRIEMVFAVNTMSLFWMAKKFLPSMMARDSGHFVVVSSLAGRPRIFLNVKIPS
eukprot:gene44416-biopygen71131